MFEDTLLIEDFDLNLLEDGLYSVILEADDIIEMKKDIMEKLRNSRSFKERQKWLKKLRNLNRTKFVQKK